jgi:5'-3' exonuclease
MSKNTYKEMLNSIKPSKEEELYLNSRVLLVDSMNTFLRSFAMINHMNPAGAHIGGLTGFLKSIGFAIRHIKPTRVILVFDGMGSTTNKKNLYADYKANRKLTRITNWDGFDNKEEEVASIENQILRLIHYLKCLPVDLLVIDKVEADDVIGHLVTKLDDEVYIMSADQDFLQLVTDKVTCYSPVKKKFYTPELVKTDYKLYPQNYINQKILMGDNSDNITGVKGLGPKKLFKLFPELEQPELVTFSDIMNKCKEKRSEHGLYEDICNFEKQLLVNQQLMDLTNPEIPENSILEIDEVLNNEPSKLDKQVFLAMYNEDKLGNAIPNVEFWLSEIFNYLQTYKIK